VRKKELFDESCYFNETSKEQDIKKRANIVLAVVHMGLYEDNSKGSRRLAKNVPVRYGL
jgi:hypothetical protein